MGVTFFEMICPCNGDRFARSRVLRALTRSKKFSADLDNYEKQKESIEHLIKCLIQDNPKDRPSLYVLRWYTLELFWRFISEIKQKEEIQEVIVQKMLSQLRGELKADLVACFDLV